MAIPSNRKAVLLAIFIAFGEYMVACVDAVSYQHNYPGGFLFGYDIGVISVSFVYSLY